MNAASLEGLMWPLRFRSVTMAGVTGREPSMKLWTGRGRRSRSTLVRAGEAGGVRALRSAVPSVRRFTVRDGMVLVAVAAVAAVGYRINDATMTEREFVRSGALNLGGWEMLAGPPFAALTLGLAVVR